MHYNFDLTHQAFTRAIVRDGIRTGNQRHNSHATKDRDSAVDDCVEGPSAMIKQKIKDSGSLRKWSGVAIIVYIGRIAARAKYDCHYIL